MPHGFQPPTTFHRQPRGSDCTGAMQFHPSNEGMEKSFQGLLSPSAATRMGRRVGRINVACPTQLAISQPRLESAKSCGGCLPQGPVWVAGERASGPTPFKPWGFIAHRGGGPPRRARGRPHPPTLCFSSTPATTFSCPSQTSNSSNFTETHQCASFASSKPLVGVAKRTTGSTS